MTAAPTLWKGALVGVAAGLAGSLAMDRFQALLATFSSGEQKDEPATQQAADRIAGTITGKAVPDGAKPAAGAAVHYVLGAVLGTLYGMAAEAEPAVTAGGGTMFGLGTAALLDEAAVPAARLGKAPWQVPASTHAYTISAHLVFGSVAELTRRTLRRALG